MRFGNTWPGQHPWRRSRGSSRRRVLSLFPCHYGVLQQVHQLNINRTQYLSGPWQASTRVACVRLAHEHPKAVEYRGLPVHTGTQGGKLTGPQQMQAPSPAVAIRSFVGGTMILIGRKPLHGIEELKTIGTVGCSSADNLLRMTDASIRGEGHRAKCQHDICGADGGLG